MASGIEFVLEDEKQEELCLFIDSYKGLSAYDIAVKNGFRGTEKEWVDSLHTETAKQEQQKIDYNTLINLPTYRGKPIKGDLVLEDWVKAEAAIKKDLESLIPPQIVVDNSPQDNSTNAVSSSGVKRFVEDSIAAIKMPTITIDNSPQDNSANAVSSGGVKKFVENSIAAIKMPNITIDDAPQNGSANAVSSSGVKKFVEDTVAAIDIPKIVIDEVPQDNSRNCVTSSGTKKYIDSSIGDVKNYIEQSIGTIKHSLKNCIVKVTTCDIYLTRTTGGILKPINNTKTVLHKITGASKFDRATWTHFVLCGFKSTSPTSEEDTIVFDSPITLMQYDYIDFDKQELVQKTSISGSNITELSEPVITPIVAEKEYTVYTNGTEEVLTTTEHLMPQITQEYLKYILEE